MHAGEELMFSFNSQKELPHLACIAALFAAAAIVWPLVPDQFPVHWNLAGEADRYGGKFEGLLLLPLVTLGLYLLLLFIPRIDAQRTTAPEFQAGYFWIRISLTAFLTLIYGLMLVTAFGRPV